MSPEEKVQKVLQALIDAAEFGDELEPGKFWQAIGEDPKDHLSEDGVESLRHDGYGLWWGK